MRVSSDQLAARSISAHSLIIIWRQTADRNVNFYVERWFIKSCPWYSFIRLFSKYHSFLFVIHKKKSERIFIPFYTCREHSFKSNLTCYLSSGFLSTTSKPNGEHYLGIMIALFYHRVKPFLNLLYREISISIIYLGKFKFPSKFDNYKICCFSNHYWEKYTLVCKN